MTVCLFKVCVIIFTLLNVLHHIYTECLNNQTTMATVNSLRLSCDQTVSCHNENREGKEVFVMDKILSTTFLK